MTSVRCQSVPRGGIARLGGCAMGQPRGNAAQFRCVLRVPSAYDAASTRMFGRS